MEFFLKVHTVDSLITPGVWEGRGMYVTLNTLLPFCTVSMPGEVKGVNVYRYMIRVRWCDGANAPSVITLMSHCICDQYICIICNRRRRRFTQSASMLTLPDHVESNKNEPETTKNRSLTPSVEHSWLFVIREQNKQT